MFIRVLSVVIAVSLLLAQLAVASPFLEGNVPKKNEAKPESTAPKAKLPSTPLPPLPLPGGGQSALPLKQRWEFVGNINNRVIVTDTQSGEILSLADGESLGGGCVATATGVYCGKGASEKRSKASRSTQNDNTVRLSDLVFSAQNIAQKCVQLDETLKTEMAHSSLALKDREKEVDHLKHELQLSKNEQERLQGEKKLTLQQLDASHASLQKALTEKKQAKDEVALLLTTIELLKRDKATSSFKVPGTQGHIFKGEDGVTTILLKLIEDKEPAAAQ